MDITYCIYLLFLGIFTGAFLILNALNSERIHPPIMMPDERDPFTKKLCTEYENFAVQNPELCNI